MQTQKTNGLLLKDLLTDIISVVPQWTQKIMGLTQDSRCVKNGDLFFAVPSTLATASMDGRHFMQDAIAKGAAAILAEAHGLAEFSNQQFSTGKPTVPVIPVENLLHKIGLIAARFYGDPSTHMQVIGITGTNGKTSCSHFIAKALEMNGEVCGVIGTLGCGVYGKLLQTGLTTPDAILLQKLLADFYAQQAKYVAMEASSHGLSQDRVAGVQFTIGVFTNLTREHLDYHGNMQNYAAAKRLLFNQPGLQYAVLNADDPYGKQWAQELKQTLSVFTYGLNASTVFSDHSHHTYAHAIQLNNTGITASLHTPWGEGVLHNPYLLGHFSLSNLLAVLTVLGILGMPLSEILAYLARLRGVMGRMETFGGGKQPLVVVDYAHTPDALQQVLQVLRTHSQGKIWCVFGCGGNRDSGKRPLMGKIAEQYADRIIVTDDNPRHEDPLQIVADVLAGLDSPGNAVVEHDRRRAIAHAVGCAQEGDIVLIAGKGHEAYQIIGDQQQAFSDSLEVQMLLAENI